MRLDFLISKQCLSLKETFYSVYVLFAIYYICLTFLLYVLELRDEKYMFLILALACTKCVLIFDQTSASMFLKKKVYHYNCCKNKHLFHVHRNNLKHQDCYARINYAAKRPKQINFTCNIPLKVGPICTIKGPKVYSCK